jgi:hypothetical protein
VVAGAGEAIEVELSRGMRLADARATKARRIVVGFIIGASGSTWLEFGKLRCRILGLESRVKTVVRNDRGEDFLRDIERKGARNKKR